VSRLRRVGVALATLAAVAVIAFLVVELAPGDPATAQLGTHGDAASREALHKALGLDGDRLSRLFQWLGDLLRLDLGRSFADGRAVGEKIAERLPLTLALAVIALGLAWVLALPVAMWRARRGGAARGVDLAMSLAYAVPVPALALILLGAGAPYGAHLGAVLAGAVCLLPLLLPRVYAHVARALDEALAADHARTLRAVGASEDRVARVALRVQALRLVTVVSVQLPALLSGAVLVEGVFGLPGLGLLAFDALAGRDHPVQLGLVMVGATLTVASTLVVDLIAPLLDPRLSDRGRA
jgi:peptide/nickel transport system permease protein